MSTALLSPKTGAVLRPRGETLLEDADGRLWPVLDGIPYLRSGRDALVEAATAALSDGNADDARVLLLADQDAWWTGDEPDRDALRVLVRDRDQLTLRDAMALLAYDRVGDYFAHRWSDPTYVAGLALLQAHWRPAASAFELACGIGHYGRDLLRRGVAYTGADVVFSKLWLARHWVLGSEVRLVCFDAAAPWPLPREPFDLVFCHDAFYFLEPKPTILSELRARAAPGGRLCLGHVHNSQTDNFSAGRALSPEQMAGFFPTATIYDDAELTAAVAEGRSPRSAPLSALRSADAFSRVDLGGRRPTGKARLTIPSPDASLRLNTLYFETADGVAIRWPSLRYEVEYGPGATYPATLSRDEVSALGSDLPRGAEETSVEEDVLRAIRRRILVDLPERW